MSTELSVSSTPEKPLGTVITFYSFKGGVGRSMALANLAVLLARAGKRVLCLDWDFEAPGLDRYFRAVPRAKPSQAPRISPPARKGGLLSILETSSVDRLASWRDYVHTRTGFDGTSVDFVCSGDDSEGYSARLSGFIWAHYFADRQGGEIIERLRNEWKAAYDYVLVDSRTGLTDSSGICTIQMPDLLLLLFAANEQSTDWSGRVAGSIREGRRALRHDRAFLPIIPLLSRFDAREESDRAAAAMDRIAGVFAPFFGDWLPHSIKPRDMLAWSVLPYMPRYSFEEALAVEDEPETGAQGLAFYYQLLSRLVLARLQGVREILAGVGVPGAALPPLLPSMTELRAEMRRDSTAIQKYQVAIRGRAEEEPLEALEALERLAQVCAAASRFADAEQLLKEAIALCEDPDMARPQEIPRLIERQAEVLAQTGRAADAEALHRAALTRAASVFGEADARTASIRVGYAQFLENEGRKGDAVRELSAVAQTLDQAGVTDAPELRRALESWRDLLWKLGRYAEMVSVAERVLGLVRTASPSDPADEAWALDRYASALHFTGRFADAVPLLESALALVESSFESESPRIAVALNNLAGALQGTAQYTEAERLFRRAVAIQEKASGPEHSEVATACGNLAVVLRDTGRYVEAEPLLRRTLAIHEKALGPEHPNVAAGCGHLAAVLRDTGRYAEAEPLARRALVIDEKALGPEHPAVATACVVLALVLRDTRRYAEAELLFRRALTIHEKALGPEHPYVGATLAYLSQCLSESGQGEGCEALWERGITLLEKGFGTEHDRVGRARWHRAEHWQRMGRLKDAAAEIDVAVSILSKAVGKTHPDTEKAAAAQAAIHVQAGTTKSRS